MWSPLPSNGYRKLESSRSMRNGHKRSLVHVTDLVNLRPEAGVLKKLSLALAVLAKLSQIWNS
jgi:hypothetical protein